MQKSFGIVVLMNVLLWQACAHTSIDEHISKNQCERAEESFASAKQQDDNIYATAGNAVEYVLVPATYVTGWTLAAVTAPLYLLSSAVAVPSHDLMQVAHDAGLFNVFVVYVAFREGAHSYGITGSLSRGGPQGVTSSYQGHPEKHFYSADAGLFHFLPDLLQEPLTTQAWRSDLRLIARAPKASLHASQLQIGQCYAQRGLNGDQEKAIQIVRQLDADPSGFNWLTLTYADRDIYRQLKSLEDPLWAKNNAVVYGAQEQGSVNYFLRGISSVDDSGVLAH